MHVYNRETSWTRELSTTTLERIFTQATDRHTRREVELELMRRDDAAASVATESQ